MTTKQSLCIKCVYFILLLFFSSVFSNNIASSKIVYHDYARICPRSDMYQVKIADRDVVVYDATKASFASFECNDTVDVEIRVAEHFRDLRVLPLSLGIEPTIDGQTITFKLPPAAKVYIESNLGEHLFIYGNAIATDKPDPDDPKVKYYRSGQVYEVGELVLNAGETVYIEGGAVLRGKIHATNANNVTIAGLGVIDGSYFGPNNHSRFVLIEDSRNTTIRDIIIIESPSWVITLYHCQDVKIDNVKEISYGRATDGIDIVSSENVRIKNCIIRNGDDCIVIKAFVDRYWTYSPVVQNTHLQGVHDVIVSGCAIQTNLGGHVFEIGHELLADSISNIKFIDCDVLGAHDHGGVFGIHNSDDALVTNIHFENIRVDHYYNKLIDMRNLKSRYTTRQGIGTARNIYFKDIFVTVSQYNIGYSISLIGGYDADHPIKNIIFDNFQLNGVKVTNPDQLDLYTRHVENMVFK